MEQPLVNRVANSGLIVINPEDFYPEMEAVSFDLKTFLFQGLILKEKDFRTAMKEHDWSQYQGKALLVHCSTDAIIPQWALMLVAAYAEPFAAEVFAGTKDQWVYVKMKTRIERLPFEDYDMKRIVIKGCGEKNVPASVYLDLTMRLRPHAQSIMYGEPCSTVPIFKRPRKLDNK